MSRNDLLSKDWCNLVFEGKNKDYGAYRLRSQAGRRYAIAMAVVTGAVCLWVVLFVAAGFYMRYRLKEAMSEAMEFARLELPEAVEGHELKEVLSGRPATPDPASMEGAAALTPEIAQSLPALKPVGIDGTSDLSEAEMRELAALSDSAALAEDTDARVGTPPLTPVEVVEVMPRFPGGLGALMKWLDANVDYPEACIRRKVKGRVEVSFTVAADGTVRDVVVIRKAHPLLDRACLAAIQKMPHWLPGRSEGRLVNVRVTLPVEFNPE